MTRLFWISLLSAFLLWPFARWDLPHYQFNAAKAGIVRLAMSVDAFRLDCGRLPHSLDELLGTWSPMSCSAQRWAAPAHLRDPYGNKIHYWISGNDRDYELRAPGRDGVYGSADDVSVDGWEWPWSPAPLQMRLRDFVLLPALLLTAAGSGLFLLGRGLWRLCRASLPAAPRRWDALRSTLRGLLAGTWLFILVVLLMPTGYRRPYERITEHELARIAGELEDLRRRCGSLPFALDQPPRPLVPLCGDEPPVRESDRIDPWGNPLVYARQPYSPGYVLRSPGADRRDGTADDIVHGDARRPWARSYEDPFQRMSPLHLLAAVALLMFLGDALVLLGLALWRARGRRQGTPKPVV